MDTDAEDGSQLVAFTLRKSRFLNISLLKYAKQYDDLLNHPNYQNRLSSLVGIPYSSHDTKFEAQCVIGQLTLQHRPKFHFKRVCSHNKMAEASHIFAQLGVPGGGGLKNTKRLLKKLNALSTNSDSEEDTEVEAEAAGTDADADDSDWCVNSIYK